MSLEKAQALRFIFAVSGWVYVRELLHALLHLGVIPYGQNIQTHCSPIGYQLAMSHVAS